MITTVDQLAAAAKRARALGVVAIDTEFVWERTYYPILGLIQLGFSKSEALLVDPLAISDFSPLAEILADPDIEIVLHDAVQDLTILKNTTGAFPSRVFDSRCAAGFAGLTASISLRNMLAALLDINITKTESRTSWVHRPLSERQCAYALDDVRHLPAAREALLRKARALGTEPDLLEELAAYDNPALYQNRPIEFEYTRVRGAARLEQQELAVLRELTAWRENTARSADKPRRRVLPDELLIALASHSPESDTDLGYIEGFTARQHRGYGAALSAVIARGRAVPQEQWPNSLRPPRAKAATKARVDDVIAMVRRAGEPLGLDPQLVGSRSDFLALVSAGDGASPEDHRLLRGWRGRFLAEAGALIHPQLQLL